jgi:hypothetical protein
MRRIAFSIFVTIFVNMLALTLLSAYCAAAKEETVDELKARFESARPEDRPEIAIRVAQQQLRDSDKLYGEGKIEQANADVEDVVAYSEKARDAATKINKRLKNIEIDVRKIAEKLRDIKRTLAFEDQPPVDQAIRRLEDVRTSLLKAMFANDKKGKK